MKIQLPNGEQAELNESLTLEEKMEVVNTYTQEWEDSISANWEKNQIKFFLDTLSNYLVWHKEPEIKHAGAGSEDKEILSRKKLEMMSKFKKTSKTINFSNLNKQDSGLLLGEGDNENE